MQVKTRPSIKLTRQDIKNRLSSVTKGVKKVVQKEEKKQKEPTIKEKTEPKKEAPVIKAEKKIQPKPETKVQAKQPTIKPKAEPKPDPVSKVKKEENPKETKQKPKKVEPKKVMQEIKVQPKELPAKKTIPPKVESVLEPIEVPVVLAPIAKEPKPDLVVKEVLAPVAREPEPKPKLEPEPEPVVQPVHKVKQESMPNNLNWSEPNIQEKLTDEKIDAAISCFSAMLNTTSPYRETHIQVTVPFSSEQKDIVDHLPRQAKEELDNNETVFVKEGQVSLEAYEHFDRISRDWAIPQSPVTPTKTPGWKISTESSDLGEDAHIRENINAIFSSGDAYEKSRIESFSFQGPAELAKKAIYDNEIAKSLNDTKAERSNHIEYAEAIPYDGHSQTMTELLFNVGNSTDVETDAAAHEEVQEMVESLDEVKYEVVATSKDVMASQPSDKMNMIDTYFQEEVVTNDTHIATQDTETMNNYVEPNDPNDDDEIKGNNIVIGTDNNTETASLAIETANDNIQDASTGEELETSANQIEKQAANDKIEDTLMASVDSGAPTENSDESKRKSHVVDIDEVRKTGLDTDVVTNEVEEMWKVIIESSGPNEDYTVTRKISTTDAKPSRPRETAMPWHSHAASDGSGSGSNIEKECKNETQAGNARKMDATANGSVRQSENGSVPTRRRPSARPKRKMHLAF